MNRLIKWAIFFGIGIIILIILINSTEKTEATTLHVGPGQTYTKIQDAINNSNEGDTIFIHNGTYNEHIYIYKSLNITGEDRDMVKLDSKVGNAGIEAMYSNMNLNISNISISNSYWGITLGCTGNITNVNISNTVFGIACQSYKNLSIHDNIFYKNTCAINIDINLERPISIYNNTITNNNLGIYIRDMDTWYLDFFYNIYNNVIVNNTINVKNDGPVLFVNVENNWFGTTNDLIIRSYIEGRVNYKPCLTSSPSWYTGPSIITFDYDFLTKNELKDLQDQINNILENISNLKFNISDEIANDIYLSLEFDNLWNEIDQLKTNIFELEYNNYTLNLKIDDILTEINKLKNDLKNDLESLELNDTKIIGDLSSLTDHLEKVLIELNGLKIENKALNVSLESIENDLSDLIESTNNSKQKLEEIELEYDSVQLNQTNLQDIISEMENLTYANQDLESELDELDKKLNENDTNIFVSNAILLSLIIFIVILLIYIFSNRIFKKKNRSENK